MNTQTTGPKSYRAKSLPVFEAMQYDGRNHREIERWAKDYDPTAYLFSSTPDYMVIRSSGGCSVTVSRGHFVLIENNIPQAFPPDVFLHAYEESPSCTMSASDVIATSKRPMNFQELVRLVGYKIRRKGGRGVSLILSVENYALGPMVVLAQPTLAAPMIHQIGEEDLKDYEFLNPGSGNWEPFEEDVE